jgi:hypothetical protein
MQANAQPSGEQPADEQPAGPEPWVSDLRQELVDEGYDPSRVDQLITSSLERFRSSRIHDFIPLLVERAVNRALRAPHQL